MQILAMFQESYNICPVQQYVNEMALMFFLIRLKFLNLGTAPMLALCETAGRG